VNAAHSFPEGDTGANVIRIVTSTDAHGRAVVEVRDTGAGIPAHLVARVFDPFFTTKPIGVGTGLGLAISHTIVVAMGGEISVHSEVGRGTTVRVLLPPSRSTELPARDEPTVETSSGRRATVLVVDDEEVIGIVIRRVLAAHDVTFVETAQGALELLASGKQFDVVFSDLMMPGMSGMELYREIVRLHPKIAPRVVFLSGGAFTPEANAFLDGVSNARMDKPFDHRELRAMVQRFADGPGRPERDLHRTADLSS
jgi:CheY-like chemotaxis protein